MSFFQLCGEKGEQEKQGKARFVPVSRAPGAKTYIGHGDPAKRREPESEREGEAREPGLTTLTDASWFFRNFNFHVMRQIFNSSNWSIFSEFISATPFQVLQCLQYRIPNHGKECKTNILLLLYKCCHGVHLNANR